jgi:hypothetical protein
MAGWLTKVAIIVNISRRSVSISTKRCPCPERLAGKVALEELDKLVPERLLP